MTSTKLDFNLTSAGVQVSGETAHPEELAAFIETLRTVLDVFKKVTSDSGSDRNGEDPSSGLSAPASQSGGAAASPTPTPLSPSSE